MKIYCLNPDIYSQKLEHMTEKRNESLNSYYESLTGVDQKKFFANEIYRRRNLKVKIIDDE